MNFKVTIFLVQFFVIFPVNIFSQNIKIEGHIISQESLEPIPYATVELKALKTGVYSDDSGHFILNVPDEHLNDSIEISYMGYTQSKFSIREFLSREKDTIKLDKLTYEIEEVSVVNRKTAKKIIGITSNKPWNFQVVNIFGGQLGRFIPNKKEEEGFIESVSYYIHNLGHPDAPFRVRIYSVDKENKCPGDDLLKDNLIVSNNKGAGWFTVDLTDHYLKFPKEGMYVMMEWIYSGDEFYYENEIRHRTEDTSDKMIMRTFYGQTLGNLNKQKDEGFWGKGLGEDWIMYNFNHKGYINVMINAKIQIFK